MERNEELNLVDAIAVVRRQWWVIVVAALLCGLLTFGFFQRQTPKYHSFSTLLIDVRTATRISTAAGQGSSAGDPKRILADQVEFARGQLVRDEVANRVGGPVEVSVAGNEDTDVLVFGAEDPDPVRAAFVVNTYVEVHQQFTADQAAQAYADALAGIDAVLLPIQTRLAELAPLTNAGVIDAKAPGVDPTLLAERKRLESELASLESKKNAVRVSAGIDKDVVTKVISEGRVPQQPFTPRVKRNALFGALAGVVLSLVVVFLADYLDDRLRDRQAIARVIPRLPMLALVPRDRRAARARGSMAAEPGAVGEAIRGLRTGVQFSGLNGQMKSVLFTSARPKEGKSTIAASLAVAMAHSGAPTVLVDADLRKPRVHKIVDLADNSVGLSSVLAGEVALGAALRAAPGVPGLLVLTSGPSPANAADLLSPGHGGHGVTIKSLIDELVAAGYFVVVDAPPVLPVADALTVARAVDGVVFVLAAGQARERDVTRAFELLDHAGANVIGVAVNKLTRAGGGYGRDYVYAERGSRSAPVAPVGAQQGGLSLVDLRAAVGAGARPAEAYPPAVAGDASGGGGGGPGLRNPLSNNGSA